MKIVSLNVGLPRDVLWHGHTVTTGIYKYPVEARSRCGDSIWTATARQT